MSNTRLAELARETISRILEETAFIFTDTLAPEEYPSSESWPAEGASLRFLGNTSGIFHLWADTSFCRYVAANMLGIDEDEDMAEQAQLFDNVVAYVPECVLTCLVELSQRPGAVEEPAIPGIEPGEKPTLH